MNHEEIKESLYDYLKGECGNNAPEIKKHIVSCPECTRELKKIKNIRSLFSASIQPLPRTVRPAGATGLFPALLRPVPSLAAAMFILFFAFAGINYKSFYERKEAVSFLSDSYAYFAQEEQTDLLVSALLNY